MNDEVDFREDPESLRSPRVNKTSVAAGTFGERELFVARKASR
jgi:hypothetical protein